MGFFIKIMDENQLYHQKKYLNRSELNEAHFIVSNVLRYCFAF